MCASASLALHASSTIRDATSRYDAILTELLGSEADGPFRPEITADPTISLHASAMALDAASILPAGLPIEKPICDSWLDFAYALLAMADLEINHENIPPEVWRERTRRRFGPVALLARMGKSVHAEPGWGGALWAARALARKEQLPELWDASWIRRHGAQALLQPDPLSRDPRTDIPASSPLTCRIPVEAGVVDVDLRCVVKELESSALEVVHAVASLNVVTTARGAHMSRLQEAVHDVMDVPHNSLLAVAQTLVADIERRHAGTEVNVQLRAKRIVPTTASMTGERSSIIAVESVGARIRNGTLQVFEELSTGVMNACPCTLTFSGLLVERTLDRYFGAERPNVVLPPTATHSQPGTLSLRAAGLVGTVPDSNEIWRSLTTVAHIRQAVLKRADEHALVERVHQRPQFSEDLARDAAVELASRCHAGDIMIVATAVIDESIHGHRAFAKVSALAKELWASP